ncbi:hypothetical protein CDAR_498021, partial [Caerostris darwini]
MERHKLPNTMKPSIFSIPLILRICSKIEGIADFCTAGFEVRKGNEIYSRITSSHLALFEYIPICQITTWLFEFVPA